VVSFGNGRGKEETGWGGGGRGWTEGRESGDSLIGLLGVKRSKGGQKENKKKKAM